MERELLHSTALQNAWRRPSSTGNTLPLYTLKISTQKAFLCEELLYLLLSPGPSMALLVTFAGTELRKQPCNSTFYCQRERGMSILLGMIDKWPHATGEKTFSKKEVIAKEQ